LSWLKHEFLIILKCILYLLNASAQLFAAAESLAIFARRFIYECSSSSRRPNFLSHPRRSLWGARGYLSPLRDLLLLGVCESLGSTLFLLPSFSPENISETRFFHSTLFLQKDTIYRKSWSINMENITRIFATFAMQIIYLNAISASEMCPYFSDFGISTISPKFDLGE